MTDRIQAARDWLAVQLQQEAAMTPGPWMADGESGCDSIRDARGDEVAYTAGRAEFSELDYCPDAAGIAAARNERRALLLIADDLLGISANVFKDHAAHGRFVPSAEAVEAATSITQLILARLAEAGYTEGHDAS